MSSLFWHGKTVNVKDARKILPESAEKIKSIYWTNVGFLKTQEDIRSILTKFENLSEVTLRYAM